MLRGNRFGSRERRIRVASKRARTDWLKNWLEPVREDQALLGTENESSESEQQVISTPPLPKAILSSGIRRLSHGDSGFPS